MELSKSKFFTTIEKIKKSRRVKKIIQFCFNVRNNLETKSSDKHKNLSSWVGIKQRIWLGLSKESSWDGARYQVGIMQRVKLGLNVKS